MDIKTEVRIPKRKLSGLFNDNIKSAEAINLVYVNDNEAGIKRLITGTDVVYTLNGEQINDEKILARIKSLVIPPAWQNVWICAKANGHLQATGTDTRNRKQYKYHPLWNTLRNFTKFSHLYDFGKVLPAIRVQLQKDLNRHGLPLEKVLATTVSIMELTSMRVGNGQYEKLYGSFGLTTLKNKHVDFSGETVRFSFVGKKGIHQNVGLKSKKLANIIKKCRDIPGKELFQYYDEAGVRHPVDSGMVNSYIKEISQGQFTAKDFRTWAGTLHAIEAFKQIGAATSESELKKNIVAAIDMVANQLGNTRTVCKKYYIHPVVIDHYSNNTLGKFFSATESKNGDDQVNLSSEEQTLMKMLGSKGPTLIAI